jgi:hypothetical protein
MPSGNWTPTVLRPLRLLTLLAALLAGLCLPGCIGNQDGSSSTPPPRSVELADLIIDPAKLPYVTNEGHPFYRFQDIAQFHDYQEGMKNPWLIEGSDLERWIWVIEKRDIDLDKVTGIVRASLTDPSGQAAFGYLAVRIDPLTQSGIDAHMNYLVRQQKDRFRLYITTDIMIVLWAENYPQGFQVLAQWLEEDLGLVATPIELVTPSSDLIAHIDSAITHDFDTITYPTRCQTKADCDNSSVEHTCLKCPGGKFVFHNLTCQERPGIVSTNSDLGLCWHASATYPADGFYTGECISTMFCLIPFGSQEVPTVHVEETNRFLPLWKERLLEHSGASDAYFRNHFYVHSTFVSQEGDSEVLTVHYYFQVDWLTLLETTSTRIRTGTGSGYLAYEQIKPVMPTATATPVIPFGGDYLEDEQIKAGFSINLTHPIDHIVTREAIAASLDERCAPGMRLIEDDVRIDDRGSLILAAWTEIDRAANKCKHATVDLESGEILSCQDSVCWVD